MSGEGREKLHGTGLDGKVSRERKKQCRWLEIFDDWHKGAPPIDRYTLSIEGALKTVQYHIVQAVALFVCKVRFQQAEHIGSQQEDGDEVGNDHKAVKCVGYVPDKSQIHGCAYDGNQRIGNVEGQNDTAAKQEFCAPRTVQTPADDGGEGEAAHGDSREDGDPVAIDGGEAGDREFRTGCLTVGHGCAAE